MGVLAAPDLFSDQAAVCADHALTWLGAVDDSLDGWPRVLELLLTRGDLTASQEAIALSFATWAPGALATGRD